MLVPAPPRYIQPSEIAEAVAAAAKLLGPVVIRLKHIVKEDTAGELAIYFRIVLADWATTDETLGPTADKIREALWDALEPLQNWGLYPYFNFRSDSEQIQEPNWAV